MLVLEVPFGKWSHLAYRSSAVYLLQVNEKAEQLEREVELVALKKDSCGQGDR